MEKIPKITFNNTAEKKDPKDLFTLEEILDAQIRAFLVRRKVLSMTVFRELRVVLSPLKEVVLLDKLPADCLPTSSDDKSFDDDEIQSVSVENLNLNNEEDSRSSAKSEEKLDDSDYVPLDISLDDDDEPKNDNEEIFYISPPPRIADENDNEIVVLDQTSTIFNEKQFTDDNDEEILFLGKEIKKEIVEFYENVSPAIIKYPRFRVRKNKFLLRKTHDDTFETSEKEGPRTRYVCRRRSIVEGKPKVDSENWELCPLPSDVKEYVLKLDQERENRLMMISSRQPKSRIKILGDKNDVEEITNNGATTPKGVKYFKPNNQQVKLNGSKYSSVNSTVKKYINTSYNNKKSPTKHKSSKKVPRTQRCGVCAGCKATNCNKCIYCLDMPCNGGPGTMKQVCKRRQCAVVKANRKKHYYATLRKNA